MSRTLFSLAGFQVILIGRFWVIAEGSEGSLGIEESSSSCVLAHADNKEQTLTKNIQGEDIKQNLEKGDNSGDIEHKLHPTALRQVETNKKKQKKKIKRQSVVALWQAFMFSQSGWQVIRFSALPEYLTQIMDKYNDDQEFAKLLRQALVGGK